MIKINANLMLNIYKELTHLPLVLPASSLEGYGHHEGRQDIRRLRSQVA